MITVESLRHANLVFDNLRIAPGITSVIGPNGSGKTTLLKLLAGITLPESGTILIDGIPPRETEIGWVNEFPDRNILFGEPFEEIASPLRFRHVHCAEVDTRVTRFMDSLGILHLKNRSMQELSGGEKVLVAIAAALVHKPVVMVLDEFDSHLDGWRAEEIARHIRKSGARYVISCTQDTEAAAAGDAVIVIEEGRVTHAGTSENVFGALENTPFYPLSWRCRS